MMSLSFIHSVHSPKLSTLLFFSLLHRSHSRRWQCDRPTHTLTRSLTRSLTHSLTVPCRAVPCPCIVCLYYMHHIYIFTSKCHASRSTHSLHLCRISFPFSLSLISSLPCFHAPRCNPLITILFSVLRHRLYPPFSTFNETPMSAPSSSPPTTFASS